MRARRRFQEPVLDRPRGGSDAAGGARRHAAGDRPLERTGAGRNTASRRSRYVESLVCAPALAVATTTMVPMTTTPTLKAWTQKPHSNVIPRPNVASQRMMPVHVNDHATAVAASVVAAVRGPRRVSPSDRKGKPPWRPRRTGRGASRRPNRRSRPATPAGRARPSWNPGRRHPRSRERNSSRRIRPHQQVRPDTRSSTSVAWSGLSQRCRPPGRGGGLHRPH
jgi:hypothetical protein